MTDTETPADTSTDTAGPLSDAAIASFVADWYAALDRHDPLVEVLPYLLDDGLVMHFPEGTLHGHAGFAEWYEKVTNLFFDEVHEVTEVTVTRTAGATAVHVVVNWQARVWNPPAARSTWLGFDADQSWTVVERDGAPAVESYTVDALHPMPGSASL